MGLAVQDESEDGRWGIFRVDDVNRIVDLVREREED